MQQDVILKSWRGKMFMAKFSFRVTLRHFNEKIMCNFFKGIKFKFHDLYSFFVLKARKTVPID